MSIALEYGIVAIIGLIFGSFLNSLAYRVPRGISVKRGRSFCPHCRVQLRWFELIPVASFLVQRGKCQRCGGDISWRYPFFELLTAGMIVLLYYRSTGVGEFLSSGVMVVTAVAIGLIDWEFMVIPDSIALSGLLSGIVTTALFQTGLLASMLLSAAASGGLVLMIRWLGSHLLKREAMGMGDVKLAFLLGFFLGMKLFLIALWIAALLGALYGLWRKRARGSDRVPFGSALAVSSTSLILFKDQVEYLTGAWTTMLR